MKKVIRHVGLDVDSAAIAAAVAEPGGEIRSLGSIPYRDEAVRKLVKKLGPASELRICYEAGPHGYRLYWLLTKLGVHCDVVAPTLIPTRAGDRVKTNRRDAEKLARSYRSGDLTPVWVPDEEHEALRDLVRAREAAKKDQLRARHRLGKFLLRRGLRAGAGIRSWTKNHLLWLETLRFEHVAVQATFVDYLHEVKHAGQRIRVLEAAIDETIAAAPASIRALVTALQALRGIKSVSAATMAAEVGPPSRFPHPKQLMGYSGMVSSEHSNGPERPTGRHHKDWECTPATDHGASGLVVSASTIALSGAAEATGRLVCRGARNLLEGTAEAVFPIPSSQRQGQGATESRDRHRT